MDIAATEVLIQRLLYLAVEISLPLLVLSFVAALVIGILQAMMQVQEQTLSFTPKLLIVVAVFVVLGPSMFDSMVQNLRDVVMTIPSLL